MSGYGRDVEYIRECGSIQGDLARRAGRLLRQYAELSRGIPDEEKLDATLCVAVLSLLLTNCDEALAVMEKDDHAHLLWRVVRNIVVGRAGNQQLSTAIRRNRGKRCPVSSTQRGRPSTCGPPPRRRRGTPWDRASAWPASFQRGRILTGHVSTELGADPSSTDLAMRAR
jgi:hypothetical protein